MKRIFLVEDEPGLVLLSRPTHAGRQVVEDASDGESGLERVAGESFDLILLDVMLPRKGGFDVLRALRNRGVVTPVIMLTARGRVADKVVGLKLGADDYVGKPFEMMELLARIERRCGAHGDTHPPEGYRSAASRRLQARGEHERRRGDGAVGARIPAAQVLPSIAARHSRAKSCSTKSGATTRCPPPGQSTSSGMAAPGGRAEPPAPAIHTHGSRDGV